MRFLRVALRLAVIMFSWSFIFLGCDGGYRDYCKDGSVVCRLKICLGYIVVRRCEVRRVLSSSLVYSGRLFG